MKIILTENAESVMEERGITEDDVKNTITQAEQDKTFIYDEEKRIAKHRRNNFTVYVEYTINGDEYTVNSAYAHKVALVSDMQEGEA